MLSTVLGPCDISPFFTLRDADWKALQYGESNRHMMQWGPSDFWGKKFLFQILAVRWPARKRLANLDSADVQHAPAPKERRRLLPSSQKADQWYDHVVIFHTQTFWCSIGGVAVVLLGENVRSSGVLTAR